MTALLVILIVGLLVYAFIVAAAATGPRCDHTLKPDMHEETGRIFYSCHCGERFTR